MKQVIIAGCMLTALVATSQSVVASENAIERPSLYAMTVIEQIDQKLPELSDQELAKVEGQQAQVNLGGPGLINVQANVNDTVDVNNNKTNVSANVVALTGASGILTVQR
jgi:hypothetical protein